MRHILLALSLVFGVFVLVAQSREQTKAPGHYMFAWTGDVEKKVMIFSRSSMRIRLLRHTDV